MFDKDRIVIGTTTGIALGVVVIAVTGLRLFDWVRYQVTGKTLD